MTLHKHIEIFLVHDRFKYCGGANGQMMEHGFFNSNTNL